MQSRQWIGRLPRITFTSDFHELLRGGLEPGRRVVIRYDPARIVPPGDAYVFGDPARPVSAHAAFRRHGPEAATVVLVSPAGMLESPDIDETGNGSVLRAEVELPGDAEELRLWFTYGSDHAGTVVDDDGGVGFHFGFAGSQVAIKSADVRPRDDGARGLFELEVVSDPAVQKLAVRAAFVNDPKLGKVERELALESSEQDRSRSWRLPDMEVPVGAILRFKLYYWIGEIRYKDDNDGEYYLAPPPPTEHVPAPPAALAAASMRWS